jgi:hypothetical protein
MSNKHNNMISVDSSTNPFERKRTQVGETTETTSKQSDQLISRQLHFRDRSEMFNHIGGNKQATNNNFIQNTSDIHIKHNDIHHNHNNHIHNGRGGNSYIKSHSQQRKKSKRKRDINGITGEGIGVKTYLSDIENMPSSGYNNKTFLRNILAGNNNERLGSDNDSSLVDIELKPSTGKAMHQALTEEQGNA